MAEEEVKSLTAPVELTKEALKRDRCVCGGEYACKSESICLKKLLKKLWFLQEAQGPVMVEDVLKTDPRKLIPEG
jgi:hypothetical protein